MVALEDVEARIADRYAGERDVRMGSVFPDNGELITLPAKSTYADQFAAERHAASSIE